MAHGYIYSKGETIYTYVRQLYNLFDVRCWQIRCHELWAVSVMA